MATTPVLSTRELTMMTLLPSTRPACPTAIAASPPTRPRRDSSNRISSPGKNTPPTVGSAVGGPRAAGAAASVRPPDPLAPQPGETKVEQTTDTIAPNPGKERINSYYNPDGGRSS